MWLCTTGAGAFAFQGVHTNSSRSFCARGENGREVFKYGACRKAACLPDSDDDKLIIAASPELPSGLKMLRPSP